MRSSTRKLGKSNEELKREQEIREQADFKFNTNHVLHKLDQRISDLALQHESVVAKSGSDKVHISGQFEDLREAVLEHCKQMNQRVGDVESKMVQMMTAFNNLISHCSFSYMPMEKFYSLFQDLEDRVASNHLDSTSKLDSLSHTVGHLHGKIQQHVDELRQEVESRKPDVNPLYNHVDQKFDIFRVDFEGILREIAILKQTVAYEEKKIENLYTQIERLKGEKNCLKKV